MAGRVLKIGTFYESKDPEYDAVFIQAAGGTYEIFGAKKDGNATTYTRIERSTDNLMVARRRLNKHVRREWVTV